MRALGIFAAVAMVLAKWGVGEAKVTIRRAERERRATQEAKELGSPRGTDMAAAEAEAMRDFADTRGLGNLGCQYQTETIVILDNSVNIFDKELWMFKLLVKEIAAALLNGNSNSRMSVVLNTQPRNPLILLGSTNGQSIPGIWKTVKGVQTVNGDGDVLVATKTAVRMFSLNRCPQCTFNLLLLTAPGPELTAQLYAVPGVLRTYPQISRFAVGTRITRRAMVGGFYAFAGCNGCSRVEFVGECTPIQFLFLVKRFYPQLCTPRHYFQQATLMTFQVDNMAVDDENLREFVNKFVDVMAQTTGVDRQYLEVLDVRDSSNAAGPQLNTRRLKSIETLIDYPQDTLLDIVIRESPTGFGDTPFRIADRFDADLRNELSPVAGLFNKEFGAIPKVRKIAQPRESIFTRQGNGLTFQKLHLNSPEFANITNRSTLAEILQQ